MVELLASALVLILEQVLVSEQGSVLLLVSGPCLTSEMLVVVAVLV
jgi:hypothetical protein